MTIPATCEVLRQLHSPECKYCDLATVKEERSPEKISEHPRTAAELFPTRANSTARLPNHAQLFLNQNDQVQEPARNRTPRMHESNFAEIPKTSEAHRTTPRDYNNAQVTLSQREPPFLAPRVRAEATRAISKSPVAPDEYVMCLAQDVTP